MGEHLLTARQAEVWEMKRKHGLNMAEIGRRLKIRPQSVAAALKGALRKLTPAEKDAPLELPGPAERLALLSEALERVSAKPGDRETVLLARDLRVRALRMADNTVLAQESAGGLARIVQSMTNVVQTIVGDTQEDLDGEDLGKLDELLATLNEELSRRGKLIDVTPENSDAT